jgi:DNA-directed RNA polymerase specialized sigma24 family protein
LIPRVLEPAGEDGLSFMEIARRFPDLEELPIACATGRAGDVYVCHPFLVHAADRHHGSSPRVIAQPPLAPIDGRLHPDRPDRDLSPVEQDPRGPRPLTTGPPEKSAGRLSITLGPRLVRVPMDDVDFSTWYEAEHPRVLGVLCALSGELDVAREATDEAFVRAFAKWERVRKMDSPGGWTYRVALNELRRSLRRHARERSPRSVSPAPAVPTTDPDLWDLVRRLPERQRLAVVLRYVADLPEQAIAEVMGITRSTAASTLTQARDRLGEWMRAAERAEDEEVDHA